MRVHVRDLNTECDTLGVVEGAMVECEETAATEALGEEVVAATVRAMEVET